MSKTIDHLIAKGVEIPLPETVWIAPEVDPDRIEAGVILHPGTRINGEKTLLLSGTAVGEEAPATLSNILCGRNVDLKGGYYKNAVFLEGASVGSGAHIREGTIFEEGASGAHTVGLKQTILFPYATLGSLINFCDVLLSGGTGKKDHSEVGSSYIHFNFTPNQDKATASILGNVPEGVMLDRPPVFLGGQGGLVGPCRLGFGTVVAAGVVQRKDEIRENRLLFGAGGKPGNVERVAGSYPGLKRILNHNIFYIANLVALRQWYRDVRSVFISSSFPEALRTGLMETVEKGIHERIYRLRGLAEKVALLHTQKEENDSGIHERWIRNAESVCQYLETCHAQEGLQDRDHFLMHITGKAPYLVTMAGLSESVKVSGRAWLQAIVDSVSAGAWERLSAPYKKCL